MHVIVLGILVLPLLSPPVPASPQVTSSRRVIVGLGPLGEIEDVLAGTSLTAMATIPGINVHLVDVPSRSWHSSRELRRLRQEPDVQFVEYDSFSTPPEVGGCGTSPLSTAQPCHVAIVDGTPSLQEYSGQPSATTINLAAAQSLTTGRAPVVAVIDTGIDPLHSLFQGSLEPGGYDFILDVPGGVDFPNGRDDDRDGLVDEAYGHGTHVAGTILFVNPDARILPLRVVDAEGYGSAYHIAEAIYYAAAYGADVINLSLSIPRGSKAVEGAIDLAASLEISIFSSAGNTGTSGVLFPASHEEVVAVAAVDDMDVKASFSAYGEKVGVSAPGVGIYSAMPGEGFAWWSGTSMACAVASGTGSLAISTTFETIDSSEVVTNTSASIAPMNPSYAEDLGSGRIDALAAATEVQSEN